MTSDTVETTIKFAQSSIEEVYEDFNALYSRYHSKKSEYKEDYINAVTELINKKVMGKLIYYIMEFLLR